MDEHELIAAALAALRARRKRVPGVCEVCQAPMPPSYTTRRYCSNACRQRAKRARVKEREGIWFDEVDTRATALVLPSPDLGPAES